jgi:superfamily II DNA/RNA helicase
MVTRYLVVDLIGDETVKSSETITHYAIECSISHQMETLADVVRVYSKGGNTLVFAPTKNIATEIATSSSIQSRNFYFLEISKNFQYVKYCMEI